MHRRFLAVAGTAMAMVALTATAAFAAFTRVETRGFSRAGGSGSIDRWADWTGGNHHNHLDGYSFSAPGDARCTETWVDYKMNDGSHHNPYLFRRCADGWGGPNTTVNWENGSVWGMKVIVCVVPNTQGNITRNSGNCSGDLGWIDLRSGRSYSSFRTTAEQTPSGVVMFEQG